MSDRFSQMQERLVSALEPRRVTSATRASRSGTAYVLLCEGEIIGCLMEGGEYIHRDTGMRISRQQVQDIGTALERVDLTYDISKDFCRVYQFQKP